MKTIEGQMNKVFTFRIKEIIEKHLNLDDLKTIHVTTKYKLYMKHRFLLLNYWEETYPFFSELDYFVSIDDARKRAEQIVENYIENQKINMALEKVKKELKTTVKIISEFEIPIG
jgi:hypothetical protein